LSLLLPLVSTPSYADVLTVPGDYGTIQAAINASADGDEIVVSPGTYVENINFNGKNITLRSTDPTDPDVVANTVIDGNEAGSVVTFEGTETPDCVFSGFTVTNGHYGIYGNPNWNYVISSLATIENNAIIGNIDCGIEACDGTIQNNLILGNGPPPGAHHGGGGLAWCNGLIQNNTISQNAANQGGGLYHCDAILRNNTICDNSATTGGGGGLYESRGAIVNCIIWGNSASGEGDQLHESSTPTYSCIQDWTEGGTGNISADPRFVDASNGDYHLQAGSPCIDAGYPYYLVGEYIADIDGEHRWVGSSVDIGSDEYGSSVDTDGDLLTDGDEAVYGTDPDDPDSDGDGLEDGLEVLRGTDPAMHDTPPGISVPAEAASIQLALLLSFPSEVVTVSPGTYSENLVFPGKDLVLRSTDPTDPDVVAGTVIDGGQNAPVVTLSGRESTACILFGLTIRNGYTSGSGAGICGNGSRAIIENNIISGNYAEYDGGGLYECRGLIRNNTIWGNSADWSGGGLAYCSGTIAHNIIRDNWAGGGGGLDSCHGAIRNNTISGNSADSGGGLSSCDGVIRDNTIRGNSAEDYGGGLQGCWHGVIRNNLISENTAERGGGIFHSGETIDNNVISGNSAEYGGGLYDCEGTIQNNTICGNSAQGYGGGLFKCESMIQNNTVAGNSASDGGAMRDCYGPIINCIIWDNQTSSGVQLSECTPPIYSCVQDWTGGGTGNITSDPMFVDPSNGDYHLRPDSPCIDVGTPYYLFAEYLADIDGQCRLVGGSVDMGSDEYGSSPDSDSDLLSDAAEASYGSDTDDPDTDGDGLRDGVEVLRGTDPALHTSPSGLSVPADAPSVQGGFFLAFPSETVTVSPGTYYENLRFTGKDVVLRSTDPTEPGVVANTIIDGSEIISVVTFSGEETSDFVLAGFTVTNGYAQNGGGIYGNGTLAAIENNIISGNSCVRGVGDFTWSYGAGLHFCRGTISNNTISSNTADGGGGLFACPGTIQDNAISDNVARRRGGGGLLNCNGTIINNTISGNNGASAGGGLSGCRGPIRANTISDNSARCYGGGLADCGADGIVNNIICGNRTTSAVYDWFYNPIDGGGGALYQCSNIRNNTIYGNSAFFGNGGLYECDAVANCIIWENTGPVPDQVRDCSMPAYCCVQEWAEGGTGNISLDPRFVDPENGDFHLQPASPCIDAGSYVEGLDADFEGDPRGYDATEEPRGDGSDYDIGADEHVGEDVDEDGLPDWWEQAYFGDLSHTPEEDYDGDGLNNLEEWLNSANPTEPDSDGDGYADGVEVAQGTDPLDPTSHPGPIPPPAVQPRAGGRGGAGGPSCFIATAAYGTPLAGEVGILSDFRDRYLLTNRMGTAFVRTYYQFSPPIARFIANHEPLRAAVRVVLTPIVAIARGMLDSPITIPLTAIAGLGLIGLTSLFRAHRRRAGPTYQES
jgi:hypothetical protein